VIKTLSLIKRRPDIERDVFRNHYETSHAPLALPLMDGLVRYVRYQHDEDLLGEVGFDVLTGFWYRDAESISAIMETLKGEAGKPILEDELKFMDKAANTFFNVSERMLLEGEEEDEHVFVLVRKPNGLSRYDCSAELFDEHWPKLLGGFEDLSFAFLREAFPVRQDSSGPDAEPVSVEPRYNAVLQVRATRYSGLERWAEGLAGLGYEVAAVRTRRFETDLS
jgi:uncharacterized protein (TIGR02118 family)